jgi:hypothetical protein
MQKIKVTREYFVLELIALVKTFKQMSSETLMAWPVRPWYPGGCWVCPNYWDG